MRKKAFSYLELVIAMMLIVTAVILATPFIINLAKKNQPLYGEYRCYARYIVDENGNGDWYLYENKRINTDSFPAEDRQVAPGASCEFSRPVGNIKTYTVTLYGGGGSGSMPIFYGAEQSEISFAQGKKGEQGDEKIIVDTLDKAFDGSTLYINFCDKEGMPRDQYGIKPLFNCIGKGGEINQEIPDSRYLSRTPEERIKKIRYNLADDALTSSDEDYITRTDVVTTIRNTANAYISNKNQTNLKKLIDALSTRDIGIVEKNKNTGISGGFTQIMQSNGSYAVANGGKGGITDKYTDTLPYDKTSLTYKNNLYYNPSNANPYISGSSYTNFDGSDANNPLDTDGYENYGEAGGAGIFLCNIPQGNFNGITKNNINYNKNVVNNTCSAGFGGMGAGGAIIIQWN